MAPTAEDYPGVDYDFPKQVIKLRLILRYQFIIPVATQDRVVPVSEALRYPRMDSALTDCLSSTSFGTLRSKNRSVLFSDTVDCMSETDTQSFMEDSLDSSVFQNRETTVYMTLFDAYSQQRTSSTQATASINKCLQVCDWTNERSPNVIVGLNSNPTPTHSRVPSRLITRGVNATINHSGVYLFGRKREPESGMGRLGSKTTYKKSVKIIAAPMSTDKSKSSSKKPQAKPEPSSSKRAAPMSTNKSKSSSKKPQAKPEPSSSKSFQANPENSTLSVQTSHSKPPNSSGSEPCSGVCRHGKNHDSSKDNKKDACFAGTEGEMGSIVTHIQLGPRDPCPVDGTLPCHGSNCKNREAYAPVKVSAVSNPRRGVFELVIRRINGTPLAKNELMLEWRHPPVGPPGYPGK
ncbi:Podospora anserina S mat+ genomic DNA chromosome 1, supercontig 6, partial [Operophtera brumata]